MWDKNLKKMGISCAVGAGSGMILSSVLIALLAFALTLGNIPAMLISPATSIFIALGSFFGGFLGAKLFGEKGIVCGGICGMIFFLVICATGGVFKIGGFGIAAVIKAAMVIIAGAFGGIIGVNYIKR